jgi:hypothetical protein
LEYLQLLIVPQNEHRSQRVRTDVTILNRIMSKQIYVIINFSMSYVINKILQSHSTLRLNAHRPKISYNTQMDPYLHRLGLYQIAIMGDCQLDKSLLTALVERWRPERSASWRWRWMTCVVYGDCLLEVFKIFSMLFYIFLKSTNLILQIPKIQENQ